MLYLFYCDCHCNNPTVSQTQYCIHIKVYHLQMEGFQFVNVMEKYKAKLHMQFYLFIYRTCTTYTMCLTSTLNFMRLIIFSKKYIS